MPKQPSIEEAVARAKRGLDDRINAVRVLAEARQGLADVHAKRAERIAQVERETAAEVAEAERTDVAQYERAIAAGWTATELRKIGFGEPEKKARVRKRVASTKTKVSTSSPPEVPATESSEGRLVS